jgi:hypothetical protein
MFFISGLVFYGTVGAESRFHVLRARTHFSLYRGRRVPFSCFKLSDSFSAVPRASGPVFIFCVPGHVSYFIEGIGSRFHILRSRTRFRWYQGHRVLFSCFARRDSFSMVPRAFSFCDPGHVFGGTEGVRSRYNIFGGIEGIRSHFHVL